MIAHCKRTVPWDFNPHDIIIVELHEMLFGSTTFAFTFGIRVLQTTRLVVNYDWMPLAHIEVDEVPVCVAVANKALFVIIPMLLALFTSPSPARAI